jgi:hypothetical protein
MEDDNFMEEDESIIHLFQITTPVHGTTVIEARGFIKQLLSMLRDAKEENKWFGYGFDRYVVTKDAEGSLWLSGEKNVNSV